MQLRIISGDCLGCGVCVPECPLEAIEMVDGSAKITDSCVGCMVCMDVCPGEAIVTRHRAVKHASATTSSYAKRSA